MKKIMKLFLEGRGLGGLLVSLVALTFLVLVGVEHPSVFSISTVFFGVISAFCWVYSAKTISNEEEMRHRRKVLTKQGKPMNQAGVTILDNGNDYELIGTLRHQSFWSRFGGIFAAVAMITQALSNWIVVT